MVGFISVPRKKRLLKGYNERGLTMQCSIFRKIILVVFIFVGAASNSALAWNEGDKGAYLEKMGILNEVVTVG